MCCSLYSCPGAKLKVILTFDSCKTKKLNKIELNHKDLPYHYGCMAFYVAVKFQRFHCCLIDMPLSYQESRTSLFRSLFTAIFSVSSFWLSHTHLTAVFASWSRGLFLAPILLIRPWPGCIKHSTCKHVVHHKGLKPLMKQDIKHACATHRHQINDEDPVVHKDGMVCREDGLP